MKQTINFTQFTDAFYNMDRQDNFTYNGKLALFDYLEQLEEDSGQEIELDVIALCCDYAEYADLENLFNDYNNLFDKDFEEYEQDELEEEFNERTWIVSLKGGGYLIQQF